MDRRLRALPGVTSAALGQAAPYSEATFNAPLSIEGRKQARSNGMIWMVTPEYFDAMGMRLLKGRWLSDTDGPAAPGAVVVDSAFARSYFEGMDPIGQTITSPVLGEARWRIIGVVDSVVWKMQGPMPTRGVFVPLGQLPLETFSN